MGWPITKPSAIYAIRCKANGKVYIGRTYDLKRRISEHFYELRKGAKGKTVNKGTRTSTDFQKDYDKYGERQFEVYVLQEGVPPDKCKQAEAFWIAEYAATDPSCGYNVFDERLRPIEAKTKSGVPPILERV